MLLKSLLDNTPCGILLVHASHGELVTPLRSTPALPDPVPLGSQRSSARGYLQSRSYVSQSIDCNLYQPPYQPLPKDWVREQRRLRSLYLTGRALSLSLG